MHAPGICTRRNARGFTLVEMVVALTLAAIVIGFAGMLLTAPLDQYALQTQRATLVDSARAAWPLMRDDLRTALPNSARVRRNGAIVVLEMLTVGEWVHYKPPVNVAPFSSSGFSGPPKFVSVNNLGTGAPGADAYAPSGSMVAVTSFTQSSSFTEKLVTITPALAFTAESPRHRIYTVSGPITYLCDEAAGTVRRYSGYSIAANQTARDTAAELLAAGAPTTAVRLLAKGITKCDFTAGPGSSTAGQVVTVNITAASGNDSILLAEQAALEYLP